MVPRQSGQCFEDDVLKRISVNKNILILAEISLNLVPMDPINKDPALVQIMDCPRLRDKQIS